MNTLIQADIFFFISSIGFGILFILLVVLLIMIVRFFGRLTALVQKIEHHVDDVGDEVKELIVDLRDNALFSFIFGKKKNRKK